ncbi:hypothetical protein MesoLjLc_35600 [Mesorhizobium sp. L-8-10]|uniref:hypothetical protein n=1 Tax=unclassified Mesorhizobium TaxID=325217 RepID=UPI001925F4BE|nr:MULTISPECIES: hypothetical protein [unclassified Mesorhizobium]BCH23896.1 hypothetical protein MesoLjLb_36810 [Mesorhizobium sp. L-8-3]BCH31630.1 hypothetical protein MesoLjLc_35600 [Mesorhizobium sp. L-8-10]
MIVQYSSQGGLALAEAEDFRKFKVLLRGSFSSMRPVIEGVTFVDDDNALVGIDVVPALPGAPAGAAWLAGYAKMVEAAGKYGWIDEEARSIRSHVEREA